MVQILPPKTSLGNTLGQALGSGLSSGIQRGSEVGFQRGMLQNALKGLDNLPQNASPIEKTKYLLQATAGLPDQGRILQALAPMLLGQGRVENIFGGAQGGPQGQQAPQRSESVQSPPGISSMVSNATQEPEKPERKLGGFLPRIKTEAEIDAFARNYASQFNDPSKYAEGRIIAESQNKGAIGSNEMIKKRALEEVPELAAHPERIPLFMQEAQRYSDLQDPNEIIQKARQSFKGVERDLDILHRGYVPGPLRGALQKARGVLGITSAFAQGGQSRDNAIKAMQGTVQNLIKKGYEQDVRTILAQEHALSPTEVEEVIHPLTEKNLSSLKSLPKADKIPSKMHQDKLDKFLRENISKDTSIAALRHKLWNEKGYDWREIATAMKKLEPELNDRQKLEMMTVEQPPVQSLSDIFNGWDRFVNFLSGAK